MAIDNAPHWWSWADIVRHADRLGIPHFQSGAVWEMGNRTALLESIYEQSPCGSFVLWTPKDGSDPLRHGVSLLRAFGQEVSSPMWLVDGQQRTRAMLDTFEQLLAVPRDASGWALVREADLESLRNLSPALQPDAAEQDATSMDEDDAESAESTDDDAEGSHFWGVVLPAMRAFDRAEGSYFGQHSESRKVLRGSMFRRLSPKARVRLDPQCREKNVLPIPVGVVPLAALLTPAGIFHDAALRATVELALRTFATENPDFQQLDQVVPWGPQFVTGHAYERPALGGSPPIPMRWADLHARRNGKVSIMVELLTGLFAPEWQVVFDEFKGMLEGNRFAVGWLPPSNVSAAIDAYVRINRAGIRVRVEERALALLSRARPNLLDDLAHFVRLRDGDVTSADSRSLLVHESEREMGFAVWITTVTRYTTLTLLGTLGCPWLGASAIDKDTFSYRLDRVGPEETPVGKQTWARDYATPDELVQECSARATQTLLLIDSILSEELWLDHRMARPSTRALMPLIDLFYYLPKSAFQHFYRDKAFRAAIARLLHWTLLAPYLDQTDLKQLIVDCHGIAKTSDTKDGPLHPWDSDGMQWQEQLRQALSRYQATLLTLFWKRKPNADAEQQGRMSDALNALSTPEKLTKLAVGMFKSNVHEAETLQHGAVGWLYAIERRGHAKEFCWQAQFDGYENHGKKVGIKPFAPLHVEAPLRRAEAADGPGLYPEKQHIVPFTFARKIVGKDGSRSTSSPANAIGNLTWLSQRQNGLEALADRWTVMDRERDGENLMARGMFAQVSEDRDSCTALALYEKIQTVVMDGSSSLNHPEIQGNFKKFREARANWVVEQMRHWLEEPLSNEASEWLGGCGDEAKLNREQSLLEDMAVASLR